MSSEKISGEQSEVLGKVYTNSKQSHMMSRIIETLREPEDFCYFNEEIKPILDRLHEENMALLESLIPK